MKPGQVVIRTPKCHTTGCEFGFWVGKVYTAFDPFEIDKMSTKFALELSTEGLTREKTEKQNFHLNVSLQINFIVLRL